MASKYRINNLCITFIFTNKLSDLFIDTLNFDTCSHHTLHKFIHKLIKYVCLFKDQCLCFSKYFMVVSMKHSLGTVRQRKLLWLLKNT